VTDYGDPDYSGADWLFPPGAPRAHGWGVPASWTERICHSCVEDECYCECATPGLITLLEHKTRVWNERVAYAHGAGLDPVTLAPASGEQP
jgi:hypothetical protein